MRESKHIYVANTDITYIKQYLALEFFSGGASETKTLSMFLARLGITLKDCEKAIKEWSERDGV